MKGCTKPNCNCIEIAEQRNGGPVKNYECLGADKDLQGLNTAHAAYKSAILLPALKEDSGLSLWMEVIKDIERAQFIEEKYITTIDRLSNNYTITKK